MIDARSPAHQLAQRNHPRHGVLIKDDEPTIVFLTVCTKDRTPWLATAPNHALLRSVWADATAWLVGRYVLLPDHLHLFAAPNDARFTLEAWVQYWKSQFSRRHADKGNRWQTDHWDTRLRRGESYDAKWEYVVHNPVRHRLVERSEDWPYQGEMNVLPWYDLGGQSSC